MHISPSILVHHMIIHIASLPPPPHLPVGPSLTCMTWDQTIYLSVYCLCCSSALILTRPFAGSKHILLCTLFFACLFILYFSICPKTSCVWYNCSEGSVLSCCIQWLLKTSCNLSTLLTMFKYLKKILLQVYLYDGTCVKRYLLRKTPYLSIFTAFCIMAIPSILSIFSDCHIIKIKTRWI